MKEEKKQMGIKMKSRRNNNVIGLELVYPNGFSEVVVYAIMPKDGDWRATVEFYDDLVKIYKKRISKLLN